MTRANSIHAPDQVPASGWSRRFGFRFLVLYLFLFNLPLLQIEFFDPPIPWHQTAYSKAWQVAVPWVATRVLGREDAYSNRSFVEDDSDSWFAWIRWGCYLALALFGAAIWVWFDVRRRWDPIVARVIRTYIRYTLVSVMFGYGILKVLLLQFPHDNLDWLSFRNGELSPFMLLWGTLGYSNAYQAFTGILEVIGGALLLFRRTTTLGALVVAAVMAHVAVLNLGFDVPVKLNSINFLFFAIYLTYPDWRRLADLFLFSRSTIPAHEGPVCPSRWPSWVSRALKLAVIVFILWAQGGPSMTRFSQVRRTPRPPLYGLYRVEEFSRNGQPVPPLLTDTNQWSEVKFGGGGEFAPLGMRRQLLFSHGSNQIVHEPTDGTQGKLTIRSPANPSNPGEATPPIAVLTYQRPSTNALRLEGTYEGVELLVLLRRLDEKDLRLLKHPFRWVGR